jgi:hypothetical protein
VLDRERAFGWSEGRVPGSRGGIRAKAMCAREILQEPSSGEALGFGPLGKVPSAWLEGRAECPSAHLERGVLQCIEGSEFCHKGSPSRAHSAIISPQ